MSYAHQFSELEDPDNAFGLRMAQLSVTILLIVISINIAVLVYARTAARHAEIAVFPIATPLLAGPGAMTSATTIGRRNEKPRKSLIQ